VIYVEVEVVSCPDAASRIDLHASERSKTSRIAGTGRIDAGSGLIFKASMFVVGSLAGSSDEILELLRDLLGAIGRLDMVDALHSLCKILEPHERAFEHIGYIDTLAISIDNVALSVPRHSLIPRRTIFRSLDDLGWFKWIFVCGGKADNYVLEAQPP